MDDGITRRGFVKAAATTAALAGGARLLSACAGSAPSPRGPALKIGHFAGLGVDEALIARVLGAALARGGDRADLFFQHETANTLLLEDGAVNRAYTATQLGCGVRVVRGDQTGYAFSEDLSSAALLAAAATAAAVADGPARPAPRAYRVDRPRADRYPARRSWAELPIAERLPILEEVNRAVLGADPRVRKAQISLSDGERRILIADSSGRLVEDLQPMTSLYATCVAEDRGRREENLYAVSARAGFELYTPEKLRHVAREAVARTLVLFDAVEAPVGEMPVVLAAGSSGILLHEAIGHGMEADFNRKGTSIYADRMGKPIAKPFVNIVDDGTQEAARGALNVDDEGNEAQRTVLVENGVLATYLHDTISARHYKVAPTGSGRRESYAHAPMPRMRSTYMLPGPHARDEIIASVKRGIYCSHFSNGQVKIGPGDFTFYVKNGMLIEDGRLTRPIKDVNLIGNGPRVLELVDMVGDDLVIDEGGWTCGKSGQNVPVSQGQPTVRVASITVGGRKGA